MHGVGDKLRKYSIMQVAHDASAHNYVQKCKVNTSTDLKWVTGSVRLRNHSFFMAVRELSTGGVNTTPHNVCKIECNYEQTHV